MLLCDLSHMCGRTWHSDRHSVAEVENPVIPTAALDWRDGKLRPLRELRADQSFHQRGVDLSHLGSALVRTSRLPHLALKRSA
jgi:hypothetical protein